MSLYCVSVNKTVFNNTEHTLVTMSRMMESGGNDGKCEGKHNQC